MNNIVLPQFERCTTNNKIVHKKINCVYWQINNKCSSFCALKNEETNIKKCSECELRKNITPDIPGFLRPSLQELKSKLPQTNVYNPSINEKVDEENGESESFLKKALSYGKAEGSQFFSGKVSLEIYEERKNICKECPNKVNPKPDQEELGWCTKCGCSSKNPRAALTNKLWMPSFECPIKKFGKSSGTGFNTKDALNSIKGAAKAIVNTIEEQKGIT
jgi:hypothetical protein